MTKRTVGSDILRLDDILQAISDIESINFTDNSERKDMLACAYAVAIIGEASNQLTDELRWAHAYIPWRGIIDMRHRIIHEYGKLSKARLLEVIRGDIPVLKEQIGNILSQLTSNP